MKKVSVIITTKNSERTIRKCLESIKNQSYKNIEIIIVDNNSADNTKKISKKFGKLYNKGPERSAQRNFGALKSKGDYLLFIDSDMYLHNDVIRRCVKVADKKTGGVIIPEKSIGKGFWARVKSFERSFYVGDDLIEAARFFLKRVFNKFKGYDESITGPEDWDLPLRMKKKGFEIKRINKFIFHDEGSFSIINSMKKKYYYAKTIKKYIKKHPEVARKQLNIFKRLFFRKKKTLVRHPLLTISMFFLKGCEFLAGGLGYIFSE